MNTGNIITGLITLHGYSRTYIADKLCVSEPTLRTRLRTGNFLYWEILKLIEILEINNPQEVFFRV